MVAEQALVSQQMEPEKRVAVVLASLDPDIAAKVMEELDPHIMTKAAESIRNLGIVPGPMMRNAISDSLQELQLYGNAIQGGDQMAVGLLSKVVGEQQAASLLELGQVAGNRFGALASRSPDEIARMLREESASVVSLVLRFLPSQLSSETLCLLDEEIRNKVVIQMATSELPADRVIDQVEKHLLARLPAASKRRQGGDERLDAVVAIMQRSSKEAAENMILEIEKQDPELADRVRDRMFVFEDIARLDDAAIRRIMQELDNGVLSVALRKADEAIKDRFFSNMSKRAAEGLLEEMEFAGKMPFSEVQEQQKAVVQVTRRLAEQGEIKISAGDEEYV